MTTTPGSPEAAAPLRFGPFVLQPAQQELMREGQAVSLGPRPYALLLHLARHAGQLVTKGDLLDAVWGHHHVSESALKGCINTLRAALGDDPKSPRWIQTLPRRGYRFIAPAADACVDDHDTTASHLVPPSLGNLPAGAGPLIGRNAELQALPPLLAAHRLLTLVGAGGIGKTRLALALAAQGTVSACDGVWLVRLDALADGDALVASIARALRLSAEAARSSESLARSLATLSLLLVLDNCEHLIGSVAPLLQQLLAAAPGLRVLATSQEPLRLQGEQVWPVAPLAWPAPSQLGQAEQFGAVALFLHHVRSRLPGFVLDTDRRAQVVALCRSLDGLPLALELAAARVPLLGVDGVLARLDERLQLLTQGSRDAAPRQQTLRATLAWSHALLLPGEQQLLHRLSVFAGSFSLDAVQAVAADLQLAPMALLDALDALRDKSLLISVASDAVTTTPHTLIGVAAPSMRLRIFDSVRSFAVEQLNASGETAATSARHAQWMLATLQTAVQTLHDTPALRWIAGLQPELDNLRAALRYALRNDAERAVALCAHSVMVWQRAGLRHEAWRWVEAVRPLVDDSTPTALRAAFAQAEGALCVYALHGLPADALAALQRAVQAHHEVGDALNEYFDRYLLLQVQLRITPDADPLPDWQRMVALEGGDWGLMRCRYARMVRGMRLRDSGDNAGYRRFCIDELVRMQGLGDAQGSWAWSYGLALAEHDAGHAERAIALLGTTLRELRAAGLLRTNTHIAAMHACMRLEQGALPDCLPQVQEALGLLRVDGALWWMAGALPYAAFWLGRSDDAARLVGWSDAVVARRGEKPGLFFARLRAGIEARLRLGRVGERFHVLVEEGTALDDASALRLALTEP